MAIKIKLKNSVVANKAPLPTDLDIGEVAINANAASPAAYIKDSAGAVVKLAGVGSVSTPDATDAVKGVVELATATETVDGVDTTRAVTPAGLKSALAAQVGSASAPATPVAGQVWVDSSTNPSTIKVWNGTAWVPQAGSTITSATAPITPATGQIWIDTSASPSVTKIWDGTAWVTATPDGAAAAAIANDAKYATKAELQAEDLWDRAGTEITPKTAGDSVFTSGAVKVGGTTAAPNLQIKADGGIVANTNGLVYDAATKHLGIGTTSPSSALDVAGAISLGAVALPSAGTARIFSRNTDSNLYIQTGSGNTLNLLNGSQNTMASFGSSVVTLQTGNTERARIDSSGRLLVGTSSDISGGQTSAKIQIVSDDAGSIIALGRNDTTIAADNTLGIVSFWGNDSDGAYQECAAIGCYADLAHGTGDKPSRLVFSTTADGASSPTERMRITRGGTLYSVADAGIDVIYATTVSSAGTSVAIFRGQYSGTAGSPGSGTDSIYIYSNGNIKNTNNSYGAISDIKLKENIVDANSQWDDLKALQVRNYNFKEGQTHTQIGLVAQEVEQVSPGLVTESPDRDAEGNDLGTVTKSVNYSVLYMKAVKALQEAMERIEVLEAKVNALEGN